MAPRPHKFIMRTARRPNTNLSRISKANKEKLSKVDLDLEWYIPCADFTGAQFGYDLRNLTDSDNRYWKEEHVFYYCIQRMVPLLGFYVVKKEKQPRNGEVVFGKGVIPTWDELLNSNVLVPGFAARFKEIMTNKMSAMKFGARSRVLQAFAMIQFEIARRVKKENHKKFPTRDQVREGILVALGNDNAQDYRKMVELFRGERRLKAYKELLKQKRDLDDVE